MSTLLINGDSYLLHGMSDKFAAQVNCSSVTNLAQGGNCNRAIIRTTVEYLESHPANFVLIGLTFWSRFELASEKQQWVNYSASGVIHNNIGYNIAKLKIINKYIQNKFIHDYQDYMYAEQTILDVLMLCGYLKNKSIAFCIYNSCQIGYDYISALSKNSLNKIANIVPLDKFVANLYLHQQGANSFDSDKNLSPDIRHYKHSDYHHLEKYLYDYCIDHNLV